MPKKARRPVPRARSESTSRTASTRQPQESESYTASRLDGPVTLMKETLAVLRSNRTVFLRLLTLTAISLMLIVGITEQEQYAALSEATREAVRVIPNEPGRSMTAFFILASSVMSGALAGAHSDIQLFYRGAVYVFLGLVVVWLLRHRLAGTSVGLRDGLYNAGAPLISVGLVASFAVLQLLPLALVVALFAAVSAAGVLGNTVVTVLMALVAIALAVLTLYWLVGTFFALIVATIPGTYPVAALRSARSLVSGKRVALFGRLLWVWAVLIAGVSLVMAPILLLDAAFGLSSGIVTVGLMQLLGAASAIVGTTYVYLLYRKVLDARAN